MKDTICKIALKKANTNCLSLMYEPPKPKCTWYQPQDQHYFHRSYLNVNNVDLEVDKGFRSDLENIETLLKKRNVSNGER